MGRPQRQLSVLRRRAPYPGLHGGPGAAGNRRLPRPRTSGPALQGGPAGTQHNPHLLRRAGEEERRDTRATQALFPRPTVAVRALQLEALGSTRLRPTHLRVLEKEQRGRRLRPPGRATREREVKGTWPRQDECRKISWEPS